MKKKIIIGGIIITLLVFAHILTSQASKQFFQFPGNPTVYDQTGFAYSTPEQFLADGGKWDEITTIGGQSFGSVNVANEYHYTTVSSTPGTFNLLKNGSGSLGSVIITKVGASGGTFSLYDATTTDATKRATADATSTITIASFASNTAVGTFVFDTIVKKGLLLEVDTRMGSTTITHR